MILLLTAVPGLDYVPLDSTITFGACDNWKCVNISIIDDHRVERPEYFHVNLLRPPDLTEGVTFNQIYGQIWIYSQDSKNPISSDSNFIRFTLNTQRLQWKSSLHLLEKIMVQ